MEFDGLLGHLNPPQREAVLHDRGPLLVLAGAGSGKTRVITHRIAHLVTAREVAPWRVLAVTFTNKAAREMRERLEGLLGESARGLTVSTFHAAAAMLLRREGEAIGLDRDFVIYDDADQLRLVRRALADVGADVPGASPRDVLSRIDAQKNAGKQPHDMVPGMDPREQLTQRVYQAYQRLLRAAHALDFGDLMLMLVELLRSNEEVRLRYQRRFSHILVDEFQDTNPVQAELLALLAPPPSSNLVVVGDDDQSIYRWRGASVDNILDFPSTYLGCRVVKLEQNYRSDQVILEAAHAVIERNPRRMDKKLWSARARGENLKLLVARDERGEAQEVAREIHELRTQGVCDYDQMAVFYRTNAQSRVIEETFRLLQVPYVLVSGRSYYDRAEVKDAVSYLRLMVNPRSDADLERIINTPARGIGDTTVERVRDWASAQGLSLFEALGSPQRIDRLNTGAVKRLQAFRQLLDRLVTFARSEPGATATAAAQYMLEETGLIAAYQAEGSEESLTRAENLRELLSATQEFDRTRPASPPGVPRPSTVPTTPAAAEATDAVVLAPTVAAGKGSQGDLFSTLAPPPPAPAARPQEPTEEPEAPAALGETSLEVEAPPLQGFLQQVSLVGEADGETGEGQHRVSVMTLHAAKGLEFDAVFLTGMEEQIFPHRRALGPEASEEDMAEERRLCYVGFTRARRRLVCSLARTRALFGELREYPPSRFLSEVPMELFGFSPGQELVPQPELPPAWGPRVRSRGPGDGPVVDRSYDQSTDFHQHGDDVRGISVHHSSFGRGVVLSANGRGPEAKLLVRFESVGEKLVVARYLVPL